MPLALRLPRPITTMIIVIAPPAFTPPVIAMSGIALSGFTPGTPLIVTVGLTSPSIKDTTR